MNSNSYKKIIRAKVHKTNTDAMYDYNNKYIYLHKLPDKHTMIKMYVLVRDILESDGVLDTAVHCCVSSDKKTITGEISLV